MDYTGLNYHRMVEQLEYLIGGCYFDKLYRGQDDKSDLVDDLRRVYEQ